MADERAFGFDHADRRIQWSHKRPVPWTFRAHRYVATFIVALLPPITGRTIFAWLWLPLVAAGSWAWFWFIGIQDTGSRDVDNEFRWMADICGWLIIFILLFAPSAPVGDRASRRVPFRWGTVRRTAIFGGSFAIGVAPKRWLAVRLVAIKRVRRMVAVVAIQLPSGTYVTVPNALFPSRSEWLELKDRILGYPVE
jgi:hypothetical protein